MEFLNLSANNLWKHFEDTGLSCGLPGEDAGANASGVHAGSCVTVRIR